MFVMVMAAATPRPTPDRGCAAPPGKSRALICVNGPHESVRNRREHEEWPHAREVTQHPHRADLELRDKPPIVESSWPDEETLHPTREVANRMEHPVTENPAWLSTEDERSRLQQNGLVRKLELMFFITGTLERLRGRFQDTGRGRNGDLRLSNW